MDLWFTNHTSIVVKFVIWSPIIMKVDFIVDFGANVQLYLRSTSSSSLLYSSISICIPKIYLGKKTNYPLEKSREDLRGVIVLKVVEIYRIWIKPQIEWNDSNSQTNSQKSYHVIIFLNEIRWNNEWFLLKTVSNSLNRLYLVKIWSFTNTEIAEIHRD